MSSSPRSPNIVVDLFVEHYTAGAGTAESTAAFMAREGNSAHAIVGRAGDLVEPVALGRAAWHAGDHTKDRRAGSRFPSPEQLEQLTSGERDIIPIAEVPFELGRTNARSVGVEHVNLGWSYSRADAFKGRHRNPASRDDDWQPYTSAQLAASVVWHDKVLRLLPSIKYVCGHEDLVHLDSMGKAGAKLDPGPAFGWSGIVALGLVRVKYDFTRHGWVLD